MSEVLVKIKGTAAGLTAACKEAVSQARESSKKIAEEFRKAKAAARSVGGDVGGAGGKLFGAGALGGMGVGGAALGAGAAVANLAIKAYEEYKSAQIEAAKAAQYAAETEEKRGQKLEASISANEAAASALDKYAGLGELTNVQTLEATKLLDALGKSYGDLGISIDDVRNKTDAYVNAMAEMAEKNKRSREESIRNQIDSLKSAMKETKALRDDADTMLGRLMNGGGSKVEEYDRQLDTMREKLHALIKEQRDLLESDPGGDIRKKAEAEKADAAVKKQKEAAEAERKAAEEQAAAEKKAAEERLKLEQRATREYERQMEILKLQQAGNEREAAIRRAEFRAEDQFGGELSDEQRALTRERAANLFDAAVKKEGPEELPVFSALSNARSPEITNSLQRIGALGGPASAAAGTDYAKKTSKTTEDILTALNKLVERPAEQNAGMYF